MFTTVRRIPEQFAHMQQKTINLTGLVVPPEDGKPAQQESVAEAAEEGYNSPGLGMLLTQVSFIFLLVSGYYAMILTNWATLQDNTSIANPKTGQVAMWIQASGQWIAILVYIWSLFAPYIMTDREF